MATIGALLGLIVGTISTIESAFSLMAAVATRSWKVGLVLGILIGIWSFWLALADQGDQNYPHFTYGWAIGKTIITITAGGLGGLLAGKIFTTS